MKKIIIVIVLLILFQHINAQKTEKKLRFTSINNIGVIVGKNSSGISLQTVNGFKLKHNWIAGFGVAYDPYQIASVPVFIDARKYFGNKQWMPFLYADAGKNYTLRNNNYPKNWSDGSEAYTFTNSLYAETGIGISKAITKNNKFFLSAGYSYKQFNYSQHIITYFPWMDLSQMLHYQTNYYQYHFSFQRLSIKMGIEF
ncbi:MAG TPA: hypothetical protein VHP12_07880 [Chitinophagaceae bacterium]|nr:hypothetical protein [Chitinophagaceae bacterium]